MAAVDFICLVGPFRDVSPFYLIDTQVCGRSVATRSHLSNLSGLGGKSIELLIHKIHSAGDERCI